MLRNTIILVLSLFVILAISEDCFGEKCAHISPTTIKKDATKAQISEAVEKEVRRQYWYYLNRATKIYEAQL